MKKCIALVLILLMLASAALAEDLPYIRQVEQYEYMNTALLTPESYPEVCLYGWYAEYYFSGGEGHEPMCLVFPGPEGASPCAFRTDMAHYLDVDNLIQYDYALQQSNSYEEFLNRSESEEYIILDGSDGVAAYIDPSDYGPCACGLIAADDFGKSAKLWICITMDKLDRKLPQEQRVQALTDAITAEVERVHAQMHTEIRAPYWSYGKYAGVKLLDQDFTRLVTFTFPVLESRFADSDAMQAALTPTSLEYGKLEGIYGYDGGHDVEIDFDIDSYAAPVYKMENEDGADVKKLALENGAEWYFYASNTNDDGSVYAWYASKAIDGLKDSRDEQLYYNLYFSGSYGILWQDDEACRQILAQFDPMITIADPKDDPYAAPVVQPEAEPAAEPAEDSWTCPDCEAENTGNFCGNCGAPKPVASGAWTCECGQENEGNFCSNCGKARP